MADCSHNLIQGNQMSKNTELAARLRCNVFADRETVDEALGYAYAVLKDDPAGLTALYVVLNTVCNEIEANEKEIA
jgi:hypothetical protein